jgi:hypothetical protein
MSAGRTISLLAWAALIAAWALPQNVTVQNSPSDFVANEKAVDSVKAFAAEGAELVDHLGEPLAPEDYSALANPSLRGLLPPVEYAHPYRGPVMLLRGQSQEAMRRICGQHPEGVLLGCARRPNADELPFVVLADEATVKANGWTMNLNELHEAGHLNGSWGHVNWRDLATLGAPAAATPRPAAVPKPVVVAQLEAVGAAGPHVPPENQYDESLPRRHPRPRYHEPPAYGPPPYAPPPPSGILYEPWTQRAIPCLPTLLTFGVLRFCI